MAMDFMKRFSSPNFKHAHTTAGVAKKLRESLRSKYSQPDASVESTNAIFISPMAVRTVITRAAIKKIFGHCSWYHPDVVDIIELHLCLIVGILVNIGWTQWETFECIFIRPKDQAGRPLRGDHRLPFASIDLSFITPARFQGLFDSYQYLYCPLVIIEDAHIQCSESIRLPFLNSEPLGTGVYGVVTNVEIERGQVVFKKGQQRGLRNNNRIYMARKVIAVNKRGLNSFHQERRTLEAIKKASVDCKGIAVSFATFVHGDTLNVLSPLADLDLFDFLRGNYKGFPRRATNFTPWHLFEQARCVVGALHFLHEELDIGGEFSCAHLDLKPENILVEWEKAGPTDLVKGDDWPAGAWKITDFGISILHSFQDEEQSMPGSNASASHFGSGLFAPRPNTRKSSRGRASDVPPRGPGPFQAPETAPEVHSKVSQRSDMFSFGCILAMLLAFILGGPEKAGELYGCRVDEYPDDDYFYIIPDGEEPQIKPQVVDWLAAPSDAVKDTVQATWIRSCTDLINSLLAIEKDDRPSADNARSALQDIRDITEGQKLMWSPPAANPFVNPASQYPRFQKQPKVAFVNGGGIKTPPNPRLHTKSNTLTQVRDSAMDQLPLGYARLRIPQSVRHTNLSLSGDTAVFVGRKSVFVYELEELNKINGFWAAESSESKELQESLPRSCFHEVAAHEGREWTSALLAGSYIALISTAFKDNTFSVDITVYNRASSSNSSSSNNKDNPGEVRQIQIGDDFKEVKLSSQGAVLVVYRDHMDLHIDTDPIAVNLPLHSEPQRAAFTFDGKWICVWYSTSDFYHWEFYEASSFKQVGIQHNNIPFNRVETSTFRKGLIALNNAPDFFGWDQHGHSFIISHRSETSVMALPKFSYRTLGAASTSDGQSLILIRHSPESHGSEAVYCSIKEGEGTKMSKPTHWTKLDQSVEADEYGLCVSNHPSGASVLIVNLDGSLVRRKLPEEIQTVSRGHVSDEAEQVKTRSGNNSTTADAKRRIFPSASWSDGQQHRPVVNSVTKKDS